MPNRILKESICTSDNLNELSEETENFFYRLLVCCDDYGRFDGRPAIIKARCYPLKESKTLLVISAYLQALHDAKLIILYQVDGKDYIQMLTWEKHQQVRAKKSKFPAPVCEWISLDINCEQGQADAPVFGIQSNPDENPNPTQIPYDDILAAYNKFCPSLPKTIQTNEVRRTLIKTAWKKYEHHEGGALKVFDTLFKKAEASGFLTHKIPGHDGRFFKADFDWLFKDEKMVLTLEGKYDDAAPTPKAKREVQL